MNQRAPTSEDPGCFSKDSRIILYVGVDHHGQDTCEGSIGERQCIAIGPNDWKSRPSVPQHPGRNVNANGHSTQTGVLGHLCKSTQQGQGIIDQCVDQFGLGQRVVPGDQRFARGVVIVGREGDVAGLRHDPADPPPRSAE